MNLEKKGTIIKISEIQKFPSGSGKLTFRIDTKEDWNNIVEFEMFKKAEYLEHLENFTKYNKVGDNVNVEFQIKTNHYTDKGKDLVFTSLSCWKVTKEDEGFEPAVKKEEVKYQEDSDLPF